MTKLRDRVAVVTGASSGLGRALALELTRRGCALVLAARREEPLEELARMCGRALVVPTDVTHEGEVMALADAALAEYGRIDIWINNAGVTLYAPVEDGPFEPHRRVIETNLFGAMFGARAAVPVFRKQRRGVLINIGSVLSQVGQAFVPTYVISKFGMRGLSEALRVELADLPDVHVCTVLPYAIDTPHFQVAANFVGKTPRALPPMQAPEKVARAIADVAERPRRVRHVPRSIVLGLAFHALFPRTTERLLLDALRRWHLSERPERVGYGNLYLPDEHPATVHGDRPPMASRPRFFAWMAARLVRNAFVRGGA